MTRETYRKRMYSFESITVKSITKARTYKPSIMKLKATHLIFRIKWIYIKHNFWLTNTWLSCFWWLTTWPTLEVEHILSDLSFLYCNQKKKSIFYTIFILLNDTSNSANITKKIDVHYLVFVFHCTNTIGVLGCKAFFFGLTKVRLLI